MPLTYKVFRPYRAYVHTNLEYSPVQPFSMSRYFSGEMPIDFLNTREK